eukprot:Sdes_comp17728_c0_seq1m6999
MADVTHSESSDDSSIDFDQIKRTQRVSASEEPPTTTTAHSASAPLRVPSSLPKDSISLSHHEPLPETSQTASEKLLDGVISQIFDTMPGAFDDDTNGEFTQEPRMATRLATVHDSSSSSSAESLGPPPAVPLPTPNAESHFDNPSLSFGERLKLKYNYVGKLLPNDVGGETIDPYGFYVKKFRPEEYVNSDSMMPEEKRKKRAEKWIEMLNNWDFWIKKKFNKVKSRCRKGIPSQHRGEAWQTICGAKKLLLQNPGKYDFYLSVNTSNNPYIPIIERDINRTYPHHQLFRAVDSPLLVELYNVLRAYSVHNSEVGYCQGMGLLVGILLMHMSPESSFWCLVSILDNYLLGYFNPPLASLQIDCSVFRRILTLKQKRLSRYLNSLGVDPVLYMADWYMCIYTRTLPWSTVLRIWDCFLFEGMKFSFRVSLAIVQLLEKKLLTTRDMYSALEILKNLTYDTTNLDVLLKKSFSISLPTKVLENIHSEEIINWKSTNAAHQSILTVKYHRQLEPIIQGSP